MNFNKKEILLIIVFAAVITTCKEKKETKEYSARVEKEYLFNQTIDSVLTTEKYRNFYKDEYINQWVHNQLLYNEAVKEGITEDPEYKKSVLSNSKRLFCREYRS